MSQHPLAGRAPRVAILDDYQHAARRSTDFGVLPDGCDVHVFHDHLADEDALVARLAHFDVVVAMRERTPFSRSLLARLPSLKLLVTTGRRNASIDVEAARAQGVLVSGTDGTPFPTAELAWGLLLALARQIPYEDRATREGRWQTGVGIGLAGKKLGLLGLGRLGSRVARYAQAFDMEVLAYSPNLTDQRAREVGATRVPLDALLAASDAVSIHLVLGERSRGLLGARELALLKPSAFLINTSRGPIVDEQALIAALRAGRIAGAGLDVFDLEPLPRAHPLLSLPNVVLTPHLGYVTEETYKIFYTHALEDILAWLAGTPLRTL